MNTQISNKLVALGIALVMNSLLLGGVAYMFNSQAHQHTTMVSLAQHRRRDHHRHRLIVQVLP